MTTRGRGSYDRSLSREQRAARERQSIEHAVAELLTTVGTRTLVIKDVSVRAGVGRNTIYLHFGGVTSAVAHVLHEAQRRLAQAIVERRQGAHAPRARCSAIAEAWLEFSRIEALHTLALLKGAPVGGARELLEDELAIAATEAQTAGLMSRLPTRDALAAVTAAFCHSGERVATGKARAPLPELVELLTELTLQAFRTKSGH